MRRFVFAGLACVHAACWVEAAPPPQTPTPDERVETPPPAPDPEEGRAPTPFTSAEIRGATPEGRSLTFLVEGPGKAPFQKRYRFLAVDDERATMTTELLDDDGKVFGKPEMQSSTWDELRMTASWPKEQVTITDATAETPAGSFACRRYVVVEKTDEGEKRTTAHFARSLPGPPVELMVELDGKLLMSMTLLAFAPGFEVSP
jgi:hypothetical protein